MSVGNIRPPQEPVQFNQEPIIPIPRPTIQSDFWEERSVQSPFSGLSAIEANRLTLRLLAGGGIAVAGGLALLTVLGILTGPVGWVIIPSLLGSIAVIFYTTRDRRDIPEELERYQNNASKMTFDQVGQAHGWTNVLQWGILTPEVFAKKYRMQLQGKDLMSVINYYEKISAALSQTPYPRYDYQIPSPYESRGMWRQETQVKTFEEILRTYPLDKLRKYNILDPDELKCIENLSRDLDAIEREAVDKLDAIEREFLSKTEGYKKTYDALLSKENEIYKFDAAICKLQEFNLLYVRERQVAQDRVAKQKKMANDDFDRRAAVITEKGRIPYARLEPTPKLSYDQLSMQFLATLTQIESEGQRQIEKIDAAFRSDHMRLIAQEQKASSVRDYRIDQAKQDYDAAVASHLASKEKLIQPIETAFRSSMNDINRRYRLALRIMGISKK